MPSARSPNPDVLSFVMPSPFCLPDELGHDAWQRFGASESGWSRVQAVVDFVHGHLEFVPGASNPWTTAGDAYRAGQGVCRDYAHDFAAWFEAYLDGRWRTFDARNNTPRIGRVVVGRGRDAVDVALITSFGPLTLTGFEVHADATSGNPTAP
jgi:transglutaminase-like putative cysteine protease